MNVTSSPINPRAARHHEMPQRIQMGIASADTMIPGLEYPPVMNAMNVATEIVARLTSTARAHAPAAFTRRSARVMIPNPAQPKYSVCEWACTPKEKSRTGTGTTKAVLNTVPSVSATT
jgi:hypothetical protein